MTTTADDPTTTAALAPVVSPTDVAVPAPRTAVPRPGVELVHTAEGTVVTVVGAPDRRTASVLSCRLHEAVADATSTVVVDLGAASAADPAVERVLVCARESAADRGLAFQVR